MAGGEPEIIHELFHEVNPPHRTQLYDRSTSDTLPESKDDEQQEMAARFEMILRWAVYGTQVAVSTAVFHPFSCARVLMELGYEPLPPRPSRTLLGKPCLVLPGISSYVRFMRKREGYWGLWRGFVPNFCGVLFGNMTNDISYHLIDEFIKRKIRSSPRKAWSVFVMANQENAHYSPADFAEDLSKEVLARAAGLTISYPFQVVFFRVASQFVWREEVYGGLFDSLLKIYRQEGLKSFYGGYVPYMMMEIGSLVVVWMAAYAFRTVISGDRILLTIFRFATDYMMRTILYPFKLVGRLMAISPSPLRISSPPQMPKFRHWRDCFEYLKVENSLMRGNSIFMRFVTPEKAATWKSSGFTPEGTSITSVTSVTSAGYVGLPLTPLGKVERLPNAETVMASCRHGSRGTFTLSSLRTRF